MENRNHRPWTKKLDLIILLVAIGAAVYHLANCYYSIAGTLQHRMIHLSFALVLVSLSAMKTGKRPLLTMLPLLAVLASIFYLWVNLERLLFNIGFPMTLDVIVGVVVLFVVFWACWLSFGIILPLMTCLLLVYGYFAHYLGGPILSFDEIITTVTLTFGSYDLWGKILIISANTIFLFMLYGGMLQGLGATKAFIQIGRIMGKYSRSGPALSAVVSSALMGTTAGQVSPNVAITGAFTIPLMKKVGYKPEVAGAIEASASGGGQIMPPIMSAGAFVMADLLSVPYSKIIIMATIPALLYFWAVGCFVHLHALKLNVIPLKEEVDLKILWAFGPLFALPLIAIIILLFLGYPPMYAAFWGIVSLLAISMIRKDTRPTLENVKTGCIRGATAGARIAVACATLGPIIALITKTGLGLKVGSSVESWCGGNLFLGLIIMMIAVIILGLEVPTVAAYLVAAILAIPALVRLGLDPYVAHMFAFYFGAFSALTPPVGMAAIVASKIAKAPYLKTAFLSLNAASGAYLIPFIFAYNGSLLLLAGTSPIHLITSVLLMMLGLAVFQMGFVGQFLSKLAGFERLLAVLTGLGFMVFVASGHNIVLYFTVPLFIALIFCNLRNRKTVFCMSK
ncbi:MAG: TRAP transporter fused permease subunit [Desulfobacterales bacterium]|nr:TRAP transporter fused permease subunit [Desulfobacterales bacterium]